MTITIYGLLGYASSLKLPLESIEMEELSPGEEFSYDGRVYEIRSVNQYTNDLVINVSLVLNNATA